MQNSSLLLLFFLLISIESNGQHKNHCNIPINQKRILQNENLDYYLKRLRTDSFSLSNDRKKIPSFIKEKLYCLIDSLANKDEAWQATDFVLEEGLPERNLNFFLVNEKKDIFIIVYEHGGLGIATIIMMMTLSEKGVIINEQKNVEDIWIGQTQFDGNNLAELFKFLQDNRYFDRLNTNSIRY